MTGIGHSPLRPQTAWNRSACSTFVGKPVHGPPRCTLMMIIGNSVITARPSASDLSAIPGPLVAVTAISPPYAAPIVAVMAAISSSAWNVKHVESSCVCSIRAGCRWPA